MQRILSAHLPAHVGETVTVAGWVHRRRLLKSVAFLILRDAAGLAQVVATTDAERAVVEALTEESVVAVTGTVVANAAAPAGVELTSRRYGRLGAPAVPPPFDLFRPALTATLPTQLDHAPVALRHPAGRPRCGRPRRRPPGSGPHWTRSGFVEIHTPKIVGVGDRERRERLRARLLRPPGVPRPVAAVLQAAHGRRLRAGLRGRAGVPGRAARHRAAPGAVHVARRGARASSPTTGT